MNTKRNHLTIVVIIVSFILIALLFNISIVLGQKSSQPQAPGNSSALIATFDATKDTFVTGANGNYNTNYGNAASLSIGTSGTSPFIFGFHTLVDFDLSSLPPDTEIISATLRLGLFINQANSPASPSAEILVYTEAITETWGEYTATWSNRPASITQGDPVNPVDGTKMWEDWDVTNIVTAWMSGALPQNGINLFSPTDSPIGTYPFYSREYGIAPRLIISYRTSIPTDTPTPTSTYTPTPTVAASGSCPGYVDVYATHDTHTVSGDPTGVYGSADSLNLSKSPNTRYMFLYFPVDQVIPANQYIYSASLHLRYKDSSGENKFSPWDVFVYTPLNGFDELNTNWENQPGPFLGSMNHMSLNPSTSDMSINGLEFFVNLWHQGVYPNQGLGLSLQEDNIFFSFYSSEHALVNYRPYLRIKCGSGTPTPTPTATNTPTPTATPTAVPKTIDYIADNLEVTQGLQRYTNKVRLVEGKRTFVRFYVDVYDTAHTDGKTYPIDAKLRVYRENTLVGTLLPVNTLTGYLNIPYGWSNPYLDPNYLFMVSNNTFIFEIPSDLTNGTLRLVGNVNIDWKSPETNLINDDVETTVAFETVPQFGTKIFRVKWQEDDGTYHTTSYDNIQASLNFARQALPIPDIWAASSIYSYYVDYGRGVPHYNQLNQYLIDKWVWDYQNNNILFQEFPIVRYYALIDKNGEKVGGLANGIPGIVASGWTGWTSTFSHELAHTFGRHHATYCGADSGCANINIWGYKPCPDGYVEYPYNGGKIGPHEFSLEGFVYDNQNNFQIRSSNWYDLMSYCNPRWISDFTYHGIMNYLQPGLLSKDESVPDSGQVARSDNLLVSGAIDLNTGDLDLSPFFVIPDSTPLSSYDSGDFAIVLRDINGAELARYRFTPPVPILEQTCSLENTSSEPSKMLITELVPYDPLTARVDIEGPNGSGVIASATSGAAAPAVSVTSPNGGEIFAGDTITATWNANDADGDNLFFNVQYSPDNGTTWDMVAMNIQDTQVVIDRDNFHGSSQALIRVYASDGIHTSRDTSDGVFTIANSAPSVEITTPVTDTFAILGQTVAFSAFAVDRDLGVMSGDHLTWFSDIDGILGNGNQFSTAGLSGGIHKITVFVNDGDGGVAADSVQVTIYADSSQIPVEPDKMKVEPADIIIDTYDGPGTPFIQIYNANNNNPIAWSASSSESWLKLSSISGTSSEPILLDVNALDLPEGYYSATVTVTNMNNPSETYNVNVYLTVKFHNIYVPVVSMAP